MAPSQLEPRCIIGVVMNSFGYDFSFHKRVTTPTLLLPSFDLDQNKCLFRVLGDGMIMVINFTG